MIILISPCPVCAEGGKKIAILNFGSDEASSEYAGPVRDIFEVELFRTGRFEILERRRINLVLKEHGLKQENCNDLDCAVKAGKLLKLDYAVIGSVNKIKKISISLKFVDVRKGTVVYADSEKAETEGSVEQTVKHLTEKAVEKFFKPQTPLDAIRESSCPVGYYLSAIFPGLSQVRTGNSVKGYIIMSTFCLSAVYTGYAVYDFRQKRDEYESLSTSDSWNVFEDKYHDSRDAYRRTNIAIVITSIVYLANWTDVIFFNSGCERLSSSFSADTFVASSSRNETEIITRAGLSYSF